MKLAARIFITIGIMAAALLTLHGIFLVAHDIQGQPETPPAAPATEPKPSPQKPVVAAPAVIEKTGSGPTAEEVGKAIADAVRKEAAEEAAHQPEKKEATFSILPGRVFNLTNRHFRKVMIRAEFPVRIYSGECHNDYTVQWMCDGDPGDVFITDTRQWPVFTTPRANAVTVTMIEF